MKSNYSTDRELKALKPADRWYDVSDAKARNLIVRVGPAEREGRSSGAPSACRRGSPARPIPSAIPSASTART